MMQTLETDWWSIDIPPEWQVTREDELVIISDCDNVGEIMLTSFVKQQDNVTDDELQRFADWPKGAGQAIAIADCHGFYDNFEQDDEAIRQWCLSHNNYLLLISYSCALDDRGLDDRAVDEILSTLRIRESSLDGTQPAH